MKYWHLTAAIITINTAALVAFDVWVHRQDPSATITQVCRDALLWHPAVPILVGAFIWHFLEQR